MVMRQLYFSVNVKIAIIRGGIRNAFIMPPLSAYYLSSRYGNSSLVGRIISNFLEVCSKDLRPF